MTKYADEFEFELHGCPLICKVISCNEVTEDMEFWGGLVGITSYEPEYDIFFSNGKDASIMLEIDDGDSEVDQLVIKRYW